MLLGKKSIFKMLKKSTYELWNRPARTVMKKQGSLLRIPASCERDVPVKLTGLHSAVVPRNSVLCVCFTSVLKKERRNEMKKGSKEDMNEGRKEERSKRGRRKCFNFFI
jgi:hypothetical protein